jgi:hypothetical protein
MDRWGNGSASNEEGTGSPGEQPDSDDRLSGTSYATDARAAELRELSRRVLAAEVHLLAYVDELEEEVHRLRRRLGIEGQYEETDGAA